MCGQHCYCSCFHKEGSWAILLSSVLFISVFIFSAFQAANFSNHINIQYNHILVYICFSPIVSLVSERSDVVKSVTMSQDYNRMSEKIINIHRKRKIGSVPVVM